MKLNSSGWVDFVRNGDDLRWIWITVLCTTMGLVAGLFMAFTSARCLG